jgi:uncharacterized protein YfbU (UPF0304 family)
MELTKFERLILRNQFRILEKLDPNSARQSQAACDILQHGYSLEYDTLAAFSSDDVPRATCEEVRDILDLYRALKKALKELPVGSLTPEDATFKGFDGNEEGEHFGYAVFLIETQGKWGESKTSELNSHSPMLHKYRPMVERWKKCSNKWDLTVADVTSILNNK